MSDAKISRWRKKPVTIQASEPVTNDNMIEIAEWCHGRIVGNGIEVPTTEGPLTAGPGWRVLCGVEGEFYPCKSSVFDATYEPAL